MSSVSIWTRLGNWLRLSQGNDPDTPARPASKRAVASAQDLTVDNEPVPATQPSEEAGALSPRGRWQRREQVLQRLQQGYDEVVELLTSVRQHLDSHDERARQINESLGRLTETVSELPAANERHGEALREMSQKLQDQSEQQTRLSEVVSEWPESVRRQAEKIEEVREEVRGSREAQSEVTSTIESLDAGISGLADVTRSGQRLIETLDRKMDNQPERVLRGMKSQMDRLRKLLLATVILSALAALGAVIAVTLHFVSPG